MTARRAVVVTPTYNELPNLARHVAALRRCAPEVDVLVVDDNSPDGTGQVADRIAAADPSVFVLHRERREGLGPAYVAGFAWALDHHYPIVVEMDADGSHLATDLPRILAATRGHGLVVGSRWIEGGEVRNWPLTRKALSRIGNSYTRVMLRLPMRDPTAGFRAYRSDVLHTINYAGLASHGYSFQVEGAWRAWCCGIRIVEVPITFVERTQGSSKMSAGIVLEAVARVTSWGLRLRLSDPVGRTPRERHHDRGSRTVQVQRPPRGG